MSESDNSVKSNGEKKEMPLKKSSVTKPYYERELDKLNLKIRVNERSSELYRERAQCYHSLKDFDKEIDNYELALQCDPDDFCNYLNLANVYNRENYYNRAFSWFCSATNKFPEVAFQSYCLHDNLAELYHLFRDYLKEIDELNTCVSIRTKDGHFSPVDRAHGEKIFLRLANAYSELGDIDSTTKYLEIASKYCSDQTELIMFPIHRKSSLARAKERRDQKFEIDSSGSINNYENNSKSPKYGIFSDVNSLIEEFEVFRRERLNKIIANHSDTLKYMPESSEYYKKRAFAYFELEEYAKAVADFKIALHFAPNDYESCKGLVLSYVSLNNLREALSYYKIVLDKFAEECSCDNDLHYELGIGLYKNNKYLAAIKFWKTCLNIVSISDGLIPSEYIPYANLLYHKIIEAYILLGDLKIAEKIYLTAKKYGMKTEFAEIVKKAEKVNNKPDDKKPTSEIKPGDEEKVFPEEVNTNVDREKTDILKTKLSNSENVEANKLTPYVQEDLFNTANDKALEIKWEIEPFKQIQERYGEVKGYFKSKLVEDKERYIVHVLIYNNRKNLSDDKKKKERIDFYHVKSVLDNFDLLISGDFPVDMFVASMERKKLLNDSKDGFFEAYIEVFDFLNPKLGKIKTSVDYNELKEILYKNVKKHNYQEFRRTLRRVIGLFQIKNGISHNIFEKVIDRGEEKERKKDNANRHEFEKSIFNYGLSSKSGFTFIIDKSDIFFSYLN